MTVFWTLEEDCAESSLLIENLRPTVERGGHSASFKLWPNSLLPQLWRWKVIENWQNPKKWQIRYTEDIFSSTKRGGLRHRRAFEAVELKVYVSKNRTQFTALFSGIWFGHNRCPNRKLLGKGQHGSYILTGFCIFWQGNACLACSVSVCGSKGDETES